MPLVDTGRTYAKLQNSVIQNPEYRKICAECATFAQFGVSNTAELLADPFRPFDCFVLDPDEPSM